MDFETQINALADDLEAAAPVLTALGSEVRQHIIVAMLREPGRCGMRVGDIAKVANLSRPAVSHHMQELKRAGIVKVRREGTRNYYYFDVDAKAFFEVERVMGRAKAILAAYKGYDVCERET